MSFQQGLSGLSAATKSLETIGNNVANANTVGFKSSNAVFADVYAASLSSGSAANVGLGVRVAQVAQNFVQGNITGTSNPLDIAINGDGFFRMSTNGAVTYARNGQFQLDREGFVVSPNGARLTGYVANANGVLSTGAPQDLNINSADLPPRQTEAMQFTLNFDSRKEVPATTPFNSADPTSFSNATSGTVYDSLGNSHVLQTFFVKTGPNSWDVYAASDDVAIGEVAAEPAVNPGPTVTAPGTPTSFTAITADTFSINGISVGAVAAGTTALEQGTNVANAINAAFIPDITASVDAVGVVTLTNASGGAITIGMNGAAVDDATADANKAQLLAQTGFGDAQVGTQAVTATRMGTVNFTSDGTIDPATTTMPIPIPMTVGTGATSPFAVELDLTGSTQFGSNFSVNRITQDGYASGRLAGFNVGSDGVISGRYTNGKTATLGQVVLANFTNPNGLQPLGDNMWADTSNSGPALVGVPGSASLGSLQSSAVEESNVDLTAELVNMITAQRVYQANAQTIKTQDQVLQTLLNMR